MAAVDNIKEYMGVTKYECRNCHLLFSSIASRDAHQWYHMKESRPIRKCCPHCSYSTYDETHFQNHIAQHEARNKEKGSGKQGSSKSPYAWMRQGYIPSNKSGRQLKGVNITNELTTKTNYLKCRTCWRKFDKMIYLRNHHCSKEDQNFYKCGKCGRVFHNVVEFQNHVYSHYSVSYYECEVCKQQFRKKENLDNHHCSHGEGEYSCSLCRARFRDISTFTQHRIIHVREKEKMLL